MPPSWLLTRPTCVTNVQRLHNNTHLTWCFPFLYYYWPTLLWQHIREAYTYPYQQSTFLESTPASFTATYISNFYPIAFSKHFLDSFLSFFPTNNYKTTRYHHWRAAIGNLCQYHWLQPACAIQGTCVDTYMVPTAALSLQKQPLPRIIKFYYWSLSPWILFIIFKSNICLPLQCTWH